MINLSAARVCCCLVMNMLAVTSVLLHDECFVETEASSLLLPGRITG